MKKTSECHCVLIGIVTHFQEEHNHGNLQAATFFELPQPGALVGLQDNNLEVGNNILGEEDPLLKGKQLQEAGQEEQESSANTLDSEGNIFTQSEDPDMLPEIPIEVSRRNGCQFSHILLEPAIWVLTVIPIEVNSLDLANWVLTENPIALSRGYGC